MFSNVYGRFTIKRNIIEHLNLTKFYQNYTLRKSANKFWETLMYIMGRQTQIIQAQQIRILIEDDLRVKLEL